MAVITSQSVVGVQQLVTVVQLNKLRYKRY